MLRKSLLNGIVLGISLASSAALAATPSNNTLSAQDAPVRQFYGSINPFYGGINPFYGSINPFYGGINPFYGSINPFYGGINPFYGGISPFYAWNNAYYGGINPFYGKISPFWGDNTQYWGKINPFSGSIAPAYGSVDPFWGNISPFTSTDSSLWATISPYWRSAGPQWGNINLAWANLQATNAANYSTLQQQLQVFLANAQAVWGAAVQKATKQNFMDGFATPLLAKFGIDPNNPASLANVNAYTRSAFFMAWYDGLMAYSGAPRVDWWMGSVDWTPLLTQIQDTGTKTTVGVLDSTFNHNGTGVQNVTLIGGYNMYVNDHGAAVASLIASPPTAGGAMGIAPNSHVLIYNPFDATGTASWTDVTAGIDALYAKGAYVINASLGVPGSVLSPEWANIMTSPLVNKNGQTMVLVKAAGNDGVMQTANVPWIGNQAPNNLILVGSVGVDGVISPFSNTPGNACILINGVCQEQNKLMYHFIVAPGENILVSNNNGGTTRMTGTSFSAPLVSGAIALLQDRWPWLTKYPAETVQIILQSARDLGAPGVDPVYGWGELDVAASQSPLNFNNLVVYQPGATPNDRFSPIWDVASLRSSLLDPGQLSLWQQNSAYIVAFETIGATYRDFDIPLSSLLTGKRLNVGSGSNPFQTYLYQRLIDWARGRSALAFDSRSRQVVDNNWVLSMTATLSSPDEIRSDGLPIHQEFAAYNRKAGIGLRFGEGSGTHALSDASGFSLRSDLDPSTGGVNPILGFASGGIYGSADILVSGRARFSVGFTQKTDDHTYIDPTFGPLPDEQLSPNHSFASVVAVDYDVAKGVKLNASHTMLREGDGLLGSQGSGFFDMAGGTSTTATTIGARLAPSEDWKIFGSATLAHSAAPRFSNSALSFTAGGLTSTAYELAAVKTGLFAEHDQMRLSIAQPLHVESGGIQYQSLQVVDRQTGALGLLNETWNVSGPREYRMEALYALPVLEGRGEVRGYGLVDLNPHVSTSRAPELAVGVQLRLGV